METIDGHAQLWKKMQYSPPGLARLSSFGIHTERVLRKGAQEGNREAQVMLALMYFHGCAPPCRPPPRPALPGCTLPYERSRVRSQVHLIPNP
jgi:hypothetical protein